MNIKNQLKMRTISKSLFFAGLTLLVLAPVIATASSSNYDVLDKNAQPGMLMSLTANSGVIEPATSRTASVMVGILANDEVSFDQKAGQVTVKTDGEASVLVSTLDGDIKVGDRIAPSSLAGIGAKAQGSGWIAGIAQGELDAQTNGAVRTDVTDSAGKKRAVYVARIPAVIKVTYFTDPKATRSSSSVAPERLQAFADSIAGKRASLLAVALSFLLLLTGLIFAGILVSSSVRSGITAIARQPLSKALIQRQMLRAVLLAVGVIATVVVGALLVLRIL